MSKAADRSRKISNEHLEAAFANLRASTTESKSFSVECPLLKPHWMRSKSLFCVRNIYIYTHTHIHNVCTGIIL